VDGAPALLGQIEVEYALVKQLFEAELRAHPPRAPAQGA
jgi:hypothetical protein